MSPDDASFSLYLMRAILLPVLALIVSAGSGFAGELRGRFSSDLYLSEQGGESHTRPYESLKLDWTIWKDTAKRSVILRSYSRWTTDLSTRRTSDPQLFVYDGYLQFNKILKRTTVKVGRQFVYAGASSALMDGIRAVYRARGRWTLDFFTGSSVSRVDPEKVRAFSDFSVYGGRLAYRAGTQWRFGVSWARHSEYGATSLNRLGLDAERRSRGVSLYGRWLYNIQYRRSSAVLVRGSYVRGPWYYSAEYQSREPSVSGSSLFSLIDFQRYREARFEAQRNLRRNIALFTRFDITFLDEDNSTRFGFGIRSPRLSLAWQHQSGDEGDRNGLYGQASRQLGKSFEVYVNANLSRYRVQEAQKDLNDSYSGALGVEHSFSGSWRMRVEGQYISSAVDDYDWRLFLIVTKNFVINGLYRGMNR